jgi:hypothetical protein
MIGGKRFAHCDRAAPAAVAVLTEAAPSTDIAATSTA